MKAILTRNKSDKVQTLGILRILSIEYIKHIKPIEYHSNTRAWYLAFRCKTLELPWIDNKQNVSCIPVGSYTVKKHISPTFKDCLKVQDVPDRTHILIHAGNFYTDIKGCILVGEEFLDINNDGNMDVVDSKRTLRALLSILPDQFEMEVR